MSDPTPEYERNSNRKLLIIGFIIVLLAINGILLYMQHEKKQKIEEQEQQIQAKDTELEGQITRYESLKSDFERQSQELSAMGISNDSLRAKLETINADLERLRSFRASSFSVADQKKYRDRAANLEVQLKRKDEEITRLKRDNEQLFTENTSLKTTQNKLSDSVSTQRSKIQNLSQKVAIASKLNADQIKISILNKRGKEKKDDDEEFRAKAVDKIKVTFRLAKNEVTEKGSKEIMMRLIEPDGAAVYNLETGGGSFEVNGNETFYTAKTDVLFENTQETGTFLFSKGAEYKKGRHTIELYTDGYKIGQSSFTLK